MLKDLYWNCTNDLHADFKTMLGLRQILQEGFPVRVLNDLGHRVSPRMLAPGETVLCMPERDLSSVAPALRRGS